MKPAIQALALVGSLLLSTPGWAHDPKDHAPAVPATGVDAQAQPAVAVVEQFSKALQAGDLDAVRTLLADDVLVLESGGAERSREEYLGHHAGADAAFLREAHVQVKQRVARAEGSLAWSAPRASCTPPRMARR
jgi:ketosteroid isomerase-like protein